MHSFAPSASFLVGRSNLRPSPTFPPPSSPLPEYAPSNSPLVYFLYPETANVRLEDMDQLFGDATTAMPTPAQHAEVESLMGMRSPVPSLDIRRGGPGQFSADSAIPGLDINPPVDGEGQENGKSGDDAANGEQRSEGIGGWISRLARRGSGKDGGGKGGGGGEGTYRRLGQDEE